MKESQFSSQFEPKLSKRQQLFKVLKAVGAVVVMFMLLTTTACSSANLQGARPENPPVQAGGNNNPYKRSGETTEQQQVSPADPKITGTTPSYSSDGYAQKRADLQLLTPNLLAANLLAASSLEANDAERLLYPGSDTNGNIQPAMSAEQKQAVLNDADKIPAVAQPVIDRSDPNANILEKTGQMFKDASAFLKDRGQSSLERPEMQPNPARHAAG